MLLILIILFLKNSSSSKQDSELLSIEKTGVISGVQYSINNNCIKDREEKGYYVDTYNQPDAPYFYMIYLGKRYTGGYSLEIVDLDIDNELNVDVLVKESKPCKDCIVEQVITYPCINLKLNKKANTISIKDTDGNIFNELN